MHPVISIDAVDYILGAGIPFALAFFDKEKWPVQAKYAFLLAVAFGYAVVKIYLAGQFDPADLTASFVVAASSALISYQSFVKRFVKAKDGTTSGPNSGGGGAGEPIPVPVSTHDDHPAA